MQIIGLKFGDKLSKYKPYLLTFLICTFFMQPLYAAAPTFQAVGGAVSGQGAITPAWPAHVIDDIALLVVETNNEAVTLTTPAGFVEVANSPQGINGTRLTVFWARATSSSMPSPVVGDSGNHQIAQIITFRGVISTGNPWDVIAGDTLSPASTNFTVPGATTTVDDTLVVTIVSNGTDDNNAQTLTWANSITTPIQRANSNTNAGNGGGFGIASGVKGVAGNYGNTTGTLGTSSVQARMSIALKPTLPAYCETNSLSDGYHIINPFGNTDKKFEIYCKNGKDYIALPFYQSRTENSNFLFTAAPSGNNYYSSANTKKAIKLLKVIIDIPSTNLIIDKIVYEDDSIGFDFSNLNLTGTPFAFVNPRDATTFTGCSASDTTKVRVGMEQVMKINSRATGYSRMCTINSPRLKFLTDYRFLEFDGVEYLYATCADIASNTSPSQLSEVTGFFYVDPKNIGRNNTNRDRPFVAYCQYQADLNQAWTFVLALDAYTTVNKENIVSKNDTCSKMGLTFYTPNSPTTFERVRQYLLSNKTGWSNYAGTVREYFTDYNINGWATDGQSNVLKPNPIPDGVMWPYGPMGIYNPSSGISGNNAKNMAKSPEYLVAYETNNGFGSLKSTGWRSLFYDVNASLDIWWVADIAAGWTRNGDGTLTSIGLNEPNGDYDANNWLGWFADANGKIVHYNDQSGSNKYSYSSYMCMSFKNIETIVRYQPVIGAFTVIERNDAVSGTRKIQTKIVNNLINLDAVILKDDFSVQEANKQVSVGIFLDDIYLSGIVEKARDIHYFGDIKRNNTGTFNALSSSGRFQIPASSWPSGVNKWASASKQLLFKFKYCARSDYEWTDCWTRVGNSATCKSDQLTECREVDSDSFAVRPKIFSIANSNSAYAGDVFGIDFKALDYGDVVCKDYNETKDSSFEVKSKIEKSACLDGTFNLANFSFSNGQKLLVDANYSDIGDINITISEKLGVEFAKIDASDTSDVNRLITPISLKVTVQPYELNITSSDFNISTGKTWLYDANVSDMFVTSRATVQANNKQHQALQNFTSSCYAQPVDLSFYYDVNNTNSNVNLSYIMSSGTMTSALKNISDINKTVTLPASLFTTSSASADYRFNIDRAYNVPLSPIDIGLRDVKVTSTLVAKDENNATVNKAARFYYGRVKTKDIVTDKTIAPHLLHVEVYSPTTISGFYQNSLNWYINADDDGTTVLSDGNFSENKAFLNNQPSSSVNISGTTSFLDGISRFNINNLLEEKGSVVHVSIPIWLWNSTISDYNNSVGASCVSHPCFDYKYIKDKDTIGIKSGTFKGSTIGNDYNATYQKSGVKTFR